ncbi:MAG: corB [Solimicrobium sp.]|jgi:Mg2+/Co2+ transporter CorB|nr:corB [Solimicrobium sp.]
MQLLLVVGLILSSAFFSMAETALLAANRYRIRHLARRGNRNAIATLWLLERTEKLLVVNLIAKAICNAVATVFVTSIAISSFVDDVNALTIATIAIVFILIVFAEISPKVIGASYPERIALTTSFILKIWLKIALPAHWVVNMFVGEFLRVLRIKKRDFLSTACLSPKEWRSIILEGGNSIPQKHQSILLNLFDLESISVEDVMTPRAQIEALDFSASIEEIRYQLTTCHHNKLPVFEGEINQIIGILHVRKAIALLCQEHELTTPHFHQQFRQLLTPAYFIPEGTEVFTQLHYFQEKRERLGIIVDEYGEVQGLVTLDDIIVELIGEFTASTPGDTNADSFLWDKQGQCVLDGTTTLRDINKKLHLDFPLDGPKTLNGLLLEILQDIPEAPVCLKIKNCVIEIVQVKNQAIKIVKLEIPKN